MTDKNNIASDSSKLEQKVKKKLWQSPSLALTVAGLLATAMVSITHVLTQDAIKEQEQNQLLNIFSEVLPATLANNDITKTCRFVSSSLLGKSERYPVYIAKNGSRPSAIIYNASAPDGYNGEIKLVVAVSVTGEVQGVRVLSHNETPGLGDKIERRKSDWIDEFNDSSLTSAIWAVNKDGGDFDAFTGATITPRAVIKAIKHVLELHKQQSQHIINMVANCEAKS